MSTTDGGGDLTACGKCGRIHARAPREGLAARRTCKGHSSSDPSRPCGRWPLKDLDVCSRHGGKAPQARAAAERRVIEAEARQMARSLGAPLDADPRTIILEEIRWSAGHVAFYRAQVQAIDPSRLIAGTRGVVRVESTMLQQAGTSTTTDVGPAIHVWLTLYNQERDRLFTMCEKATRLGLDEERIRIEREQGARIAEGLQFVLGAVTARLALDAAGQSMLRETFAVMLRSLAAGDPFPVIAAEPADG